MCTSPFFLNVFTTIKVTQHLLCTTHLPPPIQDVCLDAKTFVLCTSFAYIWPDLFRRGYRELGIVW